MDKIYIGKKLVQDVVFKDGNAYITFKKNDKLTLSEPLFELIKTTGLQEGELIDIICSKIALKWVLELGKYDFPIKSTERLSANLINEINNRSGEAIGKKFGYQNDSEMTVSDIL